MIPDGDDFAVRTVPVLRLSPAHALPALLHARRAVPAPVATEPAPAPTPPPSSGEPSPRWPCT